MFCRPMTRWICISCLVLSCLFVSVGYAQYQADESSFDLGVFAFEDKDYVAAKKYLLKAYQLNPDNPFYCHFLGKLYLELDQLDTAETYLQKAYRLNPVINELEYDLAYLSFKRSDFHKAAHQFRQIVEKDPFIQNVLACYYAGISLFQCKKYQQAIDYLIRSSRRSPSMKLNCMFYCGICYHQLNKSVEAIKCFEYVLKNASEPLKSHANQWLIALKEKTDDKKNFDVLIKLSGHYDDNVMIVAPDLITGNEADSVMQCYLSGKYTCQWIPKHQISLGIRHYQTFHHELSEYDLTGSVVDLSYSYKLNKHTYRMHYSPAAYWLERYRYMSRHRVKTSVHWPVFKDLIGHLNYTYDVLDNYNNELRDGYTHDFSMDLYYHIKPYHMKLLVGCSAQNNQRKSALYQYLEMTYRLGIMYNVFRTWQWKSYLKLFQRRYHIWEDMKRKDNRIDLSCSLSYPFWYDGLEMAFEYDYSKNNSRLDPLDSFDYRRNTYGISLIYFY